jgi:hypothetical protein
MVDQSDQQNIQSLPQLMKAILQDLAKIERFKGDYEDTPRAVLELAGTFAVDVITHLTAIFTGRISVIMAHTIL